MEVPIYYKNEVYFAHVDPEDFDKVSAYKWRLHKVKGRSTVYGKANDNGKTVYIHRLVLNTEMEIDHIDGNGLNNRRSNLRPATPALQRLNTIPKSGMKGVNKVGNKYSTVFRYDGKSIYLGLSDTEEEAHTKWLKAIKKFASDICEESFQWKSIQTN